MSAERARELRQGAALLIERIAAAAEHAVGDPLRQLDGSDRRALRVASGDLREYGAPLSAMLGAEALEFLGPVLGAVLVIGRLTGPLEMGERLGELLAARRKTAGMRNARAAKRIGARLALDKAVRDAALGSQHLPLKVLTSTVNRALRKVGQREVSASTVKRARTRLRLR